MNPSEPKPCCHCTHVRAKGEGTGGVSYYCVRYDSRVQPWETCPKFEREPGSDDE